MIIGQPFNCPILFVPEYLLLVQTSGWNLSTLPSLSQLLLLFQFGHFCKADNPEVEVTESGTNVTVRTRCPNEQCNKESTWHSQPFLPGSSIHVGNFLLPLAVVLAGGSATKMVNTFTHMGIRCISLKTFFKHVYCNGLKSLFERANIEFVFDFKPVGFKI